MGTYSIATIISDFFSNKNLETQTHQETPKNRPPGGDPTRAIGVNLTSSNMKNR